MENFKKELMEKVNTLFVGALGFVAALAWNDAVQSLFKVLLKEQSGIFAKFLYAIVITAIVVVVSYKLMKIAGKSEEKK